MEQVLASVSIVTAPFALTADFLYVKFLERWFVSRRQIMNEITLHILITILPIFFSSQEPFNATGMFY
jgi:hypothetical protein